MIEIEGSALYQWDTNRTVNALNVDIDHIHLSNPGDAYAVIMDGSTVTIPNYLLQSGKPVVAYAVKDGVTVESKTFPVHKRERPENYVYDEDRRNFIYELIANAEGATLEAKEAADSANEAADRASQFAGDIESVQKEVGDLRTEVNALDGGFEPRVEKTVVENLENGGDIFNGVHAISAEVSEQSLYDAHLVENAENGEQIYHGARIDNPHQVTAEQVGAVKEEELDTKVEDIVVSDLIGSGPIHSEVYSVAEQCSDDYLQLYGLIREDEGGKQLNVVTNEQHEADIQDAKDLAQNLHDSVAQSVDTLRLDVYDEMYVRAEVDAMVAESKAVIVTVSGTIPSHTSQEIYALIQAGKVVYLLLWGNTFTLCTACTASEAKFENSYITSVTGADGKQYQSQQFRVYLIKSGVFNNGQAVTVPGTAYIDAQIAHALGQ